jgi:hypothetical protein
MKQYEAAPPRIALKRGTRFAQALCLGLLAGAAQDASSIHSSDPAGRGDERSNKTANFLGEPTSAQVRRMADWVVGSNDAGVKPFIIVDKVNAYVFVFDGDGRLRGASRVLLGLSRGDDSVPGIGDRKMSSIRPEERTTPAGRFIASLGHDSGGRDILWVDYADAISLHRVITTNPKEHRLERLASASPLDRRISYGCINVPAKFYESVVISAFTGTNGVVYILPETKSIGEVFPGLAG